MDPIAMRHHICFLPEWFWTKLAVEIFYFVLQFHLPRLQFGNIGSLAGVFAQVGSPQMAGKTKFPTFDDGICVDLVGMTVTKVQKVLIKFFITKTTFVS